MSARLAIDGGELTGLPSTVVDLTAIDADGEPVCNAVIWMDSRGAPDIARVVGGPVKVQGYDPRKLRRWIALTGGVPDRLPVTTHHVMQYFLDTYLDGSPYHDFFDRFGLDAILWTVPYQPDEAKGEYFDPSQTFIHPLDHTHRIVSDNWRIETERIPDAQYTTTRYNFVTPKGTLSMVLQGNQFTDWVVEPLVKQKRDIDLIAEYVTHPKCDVEAVNRRAEAFGERGLVRGHICYFDVYGQPGCWQDAVELVGTERLILETYDDPEWVHELIRILQARKKTFIRSLEGAHYDLLELGGGAASSTVISPKLHEEFCLPYDRKMHDALHDLGFLITYHTCGGTLGLEELIVANGCDASETLAPPSVGGNQQPWQFAEKIAGRIALIGGVALIAIATAATGPIAFVALAAPQIARRLIGAPTIPIAGAAVIGAAVLLGADYLSQRLPFGLYVPVGLTTGLLGGIYLIALLLRPNTR